MTLAIRTTPELNFLTNNHLAAFLATVGLHASVAAWALLPSAPAILPQQVIRIAMVAPSSVAESVKPDVQEDMTQPALVKPEGLKKQSQKAPKPKQTTEKLAEHNSHLSPTSGLSSPNATAKESAITDPIFNASYLNNPAPSYPDSARRHGVQGKTMLQVRVTTDGAAQEVTVWRSSGSDILDMAAQRAVKAWRFVPAKRGDEVVEAKVIVPIEFKLN